MLIGQTIQYRQTVYFGYLYQHLQHFVLEMEKPIAINYQVQRQLLHRGQRQLNSNFSTI